MTQLYSRMSNSFPSPASLLSSSSSAHDLQPEGLGHHQEAIRALSQQQNQLLANSEYIEEMREEAASMRRAPLAQFSPNMTNLTVPTSTAAPIAAFATAHLGEWPRGGLVQAEVETNESLMRSRLGKTDFPYTDCMDTQASMSNGRSNYRSSENGNYNNNTEENAFQHSMQAAKPFPHHNTESIAYSSNAINFQEALMAQCMQQQHLLSEHLSSWAGGATVSPKRFSLPVSPTLPPNDQYTPSPFGGMAQTAVSSKSSSFAPTQRSSPVFPPPNVRVDPKKHFGKDLPKKQSLKFPRGRMERRMSVNPLDLEEALLRMNGRDHPPAPQSLTAQSLVFSRVPSNSTTSTASSSREGKEAFSTSAATCPAFGVCGTWKLANLISPNSSKPIDRIAAAKSPVRSIPKRSRSRLPAARQPPAPQTHLGSRQTPLMRKRSNSLRRCREFPRSVGETRTVRRFSSPAFSRLLATRSVSEGTIGSAPRGPPFKLTPARRQNGGDTSSSRKKEGTRVPQPRGDVISPHSSHSSRLARIYTDSFGRKDSKLYASHGVAKNRRSDTRLRKTTISSKTDYRPIPKGRKNRTTQWQEEESDYGCHSHHNRQRHDYANYENNDYGNRSIQTFYESPRSATATTSRSEENERIRLFEEGEKEQEAVEFEALSEPSTMKSKRKISRDTLEEEDERREWWENCDYRREKEEESLGSYDGIRVSRAVASSRQRSNSKSSESSTSFSLNHSISMEGEKGLRNEEKSFSTRLNNGKFQGALKKNSQRLPSNPADVYGTSVDVNENGEDSDKRMGSKSNFQIPRLKMNTVLEAKNGASPTVQSLREERHHLSDLFSLSTTVDPAEKIRLRELIRQNNPFRLCPDLVPNGCPPAYSGISVSSPTFLQRDKRVEDASTARFSDLLNSFRATRTPHSSPRLAPPPGTVKRRQASSRIENFQSNMIPSHNSIQEEPLTPLELPQLPQFPAKNEEAGYRNNLSNEKLKKNNDIDLEINTIAPPKANTSPLSLVPPKQKKIIVPPPGITGRRRGNTEAEEGIFSTRSLQDSSLESPGPAKYGNIRRDCCSLQNPTSSYSVACTSNSTTDRDKPSKEKENICTDSRPSRNKIENFLLASPGKDINGVTEKGESPNKKTDLSVCNFSHDSTQHFTSDFSPKKNNAEPPGDLQEGGSLPLPTQEISFSANIEERSVKKKESPKPFLHTHEEAILKKLTTSNISQVGQFRAPKIPPFFPKLDAETDILEEKSGGENGEVDAQEKMCRSLKNSVTCLRELLDDCDSFPSHQDHDRRHRHPPHDRGSFSRSHAQWDMEFLVSAWTGDYEDKTDVDALATSAKTAEDETDSLTRDDRDSGEMGRISDVRENATSGGAAAAVESCLEILKEAELEDQGGDEDSLAQDSNSWTEQEEAMPTGATSSYEVLANATVIENNNTQITEIGWPKTTNNDFEEPLVKHMGHDAFASGVGLSAFRIGDDDDEVRESLKSDMGEKTTRQSSSASPKASHSTFANQQGSVMVLSATAILDSEQLAGDGEPQPPLKSLTPTFQYVLKTSKDPSNRQSVEIRPPLESSSKILIDEEVDGGGDAETEAEFFFVASALSDNDDENKNDINSYTGAFSSQNEFQSSHLPTIPMATLETDILHKQIRTPLTSPTQSSHNLVFSDNEKPLTEQEEEEGHQLDRKYYVNNYNMLDDMFADKDSLRETQQENLSPRFDIIDASKSIGNYTPNSENFPLESREIMTSRFSIHLPRFLPVLWENQSESLLAAGGALPPCLRYTVAGNRSFAFTRNRFQSVEYGKDFTESNLLRATMGEFDKGEEAEKPNVSDAWDYQKDSWARQTLQHALKQEKMMRDVRSSSARRISCKNPTLYESTIREIDKFKSFHSRRHVQHFVLLLSSLVFTIVIVGVVCTTWAVLTVTGAFQRREDLFLSTSSSQNAIAMEEDRGGPLHTFSRYLNLAIPITILLATIGPSVTWALPRLFRRWHAIVQDVQANASEDIFEQCAALLKSIPKRNNSANDSHPSLHCMEQHCSLSGEASLSRNEAVASFRVVLLLLSLLKSHSLPLPAVEVLSYKLKISLAVLISICTGLIVLAAIFDVHAIPLSHAITLPDALVLFGFLSMFTIGMALSLWMTSPPDPYEIIYQVDNRISEVECWINSFVDILPIKNASQNDYSSNSSETSKVFVASPLTGNDHRRAAASQRIVTEGEGDDQTSWLSANVSLLAVRGLPVRLTRLTNTEEEDYWPFSINLSSSSSCSCFHCHSSSSRSLSNICCCCRSRSRTMVESHNSGRRCLVFCEYVEAPPMPTTTKRKRRKRKEDVNSSSLASLEPPLTTLRNENIKVHIVGYWPHPFRLTFTPQTKVGWGPADTKKDSNNIIPNNDDNSNTSSVKNDMDGNYHIIVNEVGLGGRALPKKSRSSSFPCTPCRFTEVLEIVEALAASKQFVSDPNQLFSEILQKRPSVSCGFCSKVLVSSEALQAVRSRTPFRSCMYTPPSKQQERRKKRSQTAEKEEAQDDDLHIAIDVGEEDDENEKGLKGREHKKASEKKEEYKGDDNCFNYGDISSNVGIHDKSPYFASHHVYHNNNFRHNYGTLQQQPSLVPKQPLNHFSPHLNSQASYNFKYRDDGKPSPFEEETKGERRKRTAGKATTTTTTTLTSTVSSWHSFSLEFDSFADRHLFSEVMRLLPQTTREADAL